MHHFVKFENKIEDQQNYQEKKIPFCNCLDGK